MNKAKLVSGTLVLAAIMTFFLVGPTAAATDTFPAPKEFGVYAKMDKALKRIMPNTVSDEENVFYMERNTPQVFPLGSVEYFVIFGDYQMEYLTLNPLKLYRMSALGIPRMMFGKDIDVTVTKKGNNLYMVKPKGLFGRGYYAFWINDTAWDFVIE